MSSARQVTWIIAAIVTFLLAALVLPCIGPGSISVERVLAKASPEYPIFVELRLSRTLLGLLAGGALSLAGCLFQSMLRDSLATPYTLGVSAGASLGAVLTLAFDLDRIITLPATWLGGDGGRCHCAAYRRRSVMEGGTAFRSAAAPLRHFVKRRLFCVYPPYE